MQKRILIIDSDRQSVAPLQEELERHGYFVMIAGDGETGLRQIRELCPDIVIMDFMLPDQHNSN